MKNTLSFLIVLISIFFLSNCQKQETPLPESTPEEAFDLEALIAATPVNPDQIALEILGETNWAQTEAIPIEKGWVRPGKVLSAEKTYITENIVHYAFVIAGGSGEYDKIGLHRVVKETVPGTPIHTYKTLFYQHGDAKNFTGMMLPGQLSPNTADDFGMAVYLAENDIDVWGIDQAWTMVPAEVTDHSFMEDWGIDRQVRDLKIAMAVARVLRYRTGNGVGKMLLAGYSSGVATGFAMVNDEAARPSFTRHVKGFIPIDLSLNSEDEAVIAVVKQDYERLSSMMESGSFGEFVPFRLVGNLARTAPAGDSPIIPGFSNLQTALFFGAGPVVEGSTFHYLAGVWSEGFPSDLRYVTLDQWFDFLEAGVPWEAARFMAEYNAWMGGLMDLTWDDNFGKVTVPILNVNPAGGFGKLNESSTKLLGSKDITQLYLQLDTDENVLIDFAHIDIFIANNAEEVAWKPILEWIKTH